MLISTEDQQKYAAIVAEAKEQLLHLHSFDRIDLTELNLALKKLESFQTQLDSNLIFSDNETLVKLYLFSVKSGHPERDRFNPYLIEHKELDDFLKSIVKQSKQNPQQEYVYQCAVSNGHSTMMEFRIKNGKKTAIIIDAAADFRNLPEQFSLLVENGFRVKIFAADFDRKMLAPKERYGLYGDPLISPDKILATYKRTFALVNFFRQIKNIQPQNDHSSCKSFAISYMVQAGKADYLKNFTKPSLKVRKFLFAKKIEFITDIFKANKKPINPFEISILPYSSLPNNFIKTAQSNVILQSRESLANKYSNRAYDLTFSDIKNGLKQLNSKIIDINSTITSQGLIYATLPSLVLLRIQSFTNADPTLKQCTHLR